MMCTRMMIIVWWGTCTVCESLLIQHEALQPRCRYVAYHRVGLVGWGNADGYPEKCLYLYTVISKKNLSFCFYLHNTFR